MSNKKDDYLAHSRYQGHDKSSDHDDFSIFEHEGEHYFAMLDKDGKVAMRSEGYSSDKSRDNGIQSVIKNRDNNDRWSVLEKMGKWFLSLKAGNHQEIALSGAFAAESEAKAYQAYLMGQAGSISAGSASAASAIAGTAVIGKVTKQSWEEALKASGVVEGRIISESRNVVNTMRNVLSETRNQIGETRNLIGENRRQIGKTRNQIGENRRVTKYAAIAAASMGAMKFADIEHVKSGGPAAIKEVAAAKVGGWWPILFLLLPFLLFFLFPIVPAALPAAIAWKSVPVVAPAPVVVKTCDCDALTHPIFKIPNEEPPKTTTVLGRAPEYGDSHALSPAQFYNKIKAKYEESAMERRFLDGIFKQMGYENGFKDATADLFSNEVIPRGINANLGGTVSHKTYYRKMMTNEKDRQAFRIKAANYCDMFFMKTCGNHMYYNHNCADQEAE